MPQPPSFRTDESTALTEWSRQEVEAVVTDYLDMLTLELGGQPFNKSAHRRNLAPKLHGRSDASIEFKHCNTSAVLIELGFPYIHGYQPRGNYQRMLAEVVVELLGKTGSLDRVATMAVERPAISPGAVGFSTARVDAPRRQELARTEPLPLFHASKRDYLEREALNRSLGSAGEDFAVCFERWRLVACGHERLAEKIEHVSKTRGDGLGFDVLSFNLDGSERFIEVKTTNFGRETPFFLSQRELALSRNEKNAFHLYRIFEFRHRPRLFDLPGPIDAGCHLEPTAYRARFA
jgi:hypothetical protein